MLSHLLSYTTETTVHDWDDLDVEGVGDPFDDTQLQLNRKRARHSSLGDHGEGGMDETGPHEGGGVGEVTQDGTPPGPRRTKRQHKGPRGCGTDHSKGKKDNNICVEDYLNKVIMMSTRTPDSVTTQQTIGADGVPCTEKDDEYESSLEDVDLHLGEDGHDVDVANELNGMRIFEAPSTIMTRDTWKNVVDPSPPIVTKSNLGWDGISELFEGHVIDCFFSFYEGEEEWKITRYSGPHSCVAVSSTPDHHQLMARYIASCIVNVVSKEPSLKIKVLQAMINELSGGYNPSYDKTWLGKQIAIATIFGDCDKSYEKLPMYLAALQKYNPGTQVQLNTVPSVLPRTVIFGQVFWAFTPAIEGFRYCWPVICVDDRETKESWGWFLNCLRGYVTDRTRLCLISDRHGELVTFTKDELGWRPPYTHHRYCARHIRANYVKRHSQAARRQVFNAAKEIQ
ncbi:hypothetical protein Vadar_003550 [Vaccinium darrowii]|uniref:Uncharacterized protein n=1 Tax=Vaccinium darrowii TaxID=229202 RepID=A0ACB7Y4J2_9ERIC|nr:hypothetical protein Vadar_003550 [Vaccinium darrowii]